MMPPGQGQGDRRSQRTFGVSATLVCGLLAWHGARHGHPQLAWSAGGLGLLVGSLGLLAPQTLRAPSAVWWRVLHALGWVNTRVLLSVLFFAVVTPMGCLRRLVGWDPLGLRQFRAGRSSNWVPYPERQRDPKHYERMY